MSWPSDLRPQIYFSEFPLIISICKTWGGAPGLRVWQAPPPPLPSASGRTQRDGLPAEGGPSRGLVLPGCERFGEQQPPPIGKTACAGGEFLAETPSPLGCSAPLLPGCGRAGGTRPRAAAGGLGLARIPGRARGCLVLRGSCALLPTRC